MQRTIQSKENKDYISTVEAAKIADVSKMTITTWCKNHNLGYMVGGRWRVIKDRLMKFISGEFYYEKK